MYTVFIFKYLLSQLAFTTYYSSWFQLIYDAIHHELLQLVANYILSQLFSPKLSRPFFAATSNTWLRFEDLTNWVAAIHDPAIKDAVF